MAVIVENTETNKRYILIGASYSYYKDSRESVFGGALFPHEEEGTFDLVAVADKAGRVEWIESNKIKVIEIDGMNPKDILSRYTDDDKDKKTDTVQKEECPGCGSLVDSDERVCHSCGLTLILEE